jgi:hypothetical protein
VVLLHPLQANFPTNFPTFANSNVNPTFANSNVNQTFVNSIVNPTFANEDFR